MTARHLDPADHSVAVGDRARSTLTPATGSVQRVVDTATGPLAVVRTDDGRKLNGYVGLSLEKEGGDE